MASRREVGKRSQLSQEYVDDSSDGGSDINVSITTKPSAQKNSVTAKKSSYHSSEFRHESLDGELDDEEEETDEESGDRCSGSQSSSSEQNLKKRKPEVQKLTDHPVKKSKSQTIRAPLAIPPKPFRAPQGFEIVNDVSISRASDITELCTTLGNKQLWHITAPASVSVDSLKELDVNAALSGAPILTQDGLSYNLIADSSVQEMVLLAGEGTTYKQVQQSVSKVFHLRAASPSSPVQLQSSGNQPLTFTASAPGVPSKPRKQPEGLRMRYRPFGAIIEPEPIKIATEDKALLGKLGFSKLPDLPNGSPSKSTPRKGRDKSFEASVEHSTGKIHDIEYSDQIVAMASSPPDSYAKIDGSERKKKKKKKSRLVDDI